MTMPHRPMGLEMNLLQPNVRSVPPKQNTIFFTFGLTGFLSTFTLTHNLFRNMENWITIDKQKNIYTLIRLPSQLAPCNLLLVFPSEC